MNDKHLDWNDEREDSAIQSRPAPSSRAVPTPAAPGEKTGSRLSLVPVQAKRDSVAPPRFSVGAERTGNDGEELDDDALRAYLAEVATFGTNHEIVVRRSPHADHEAMRRLPELYLSLIERRLFDARLTYVLSGETWRATLTVERDHTYLERVCGAKGAKKATAAGDSSPPAP